jgi:uncharacterized protein YdhG (YjbR/CyaY superfamily)
MAKPRTIDEYLARLSDDKRAALERLRKQIRAAAPAAEECISYGIPAFRYEGRMLVWLAAASRHCSFFPGGLVQDFKAELKGYDTSKGTVRFAPDHPLPAALVKKLVRARIALNAAPRKPARRTARKTPRGAVKRRPAPRA